MPTGLITRNGQIVYVDRRNNKFYVLQGIAERVNQQAQKTIGVVSKNLAEISDVANVTRNFVQSVGAVGASFNRNYIKQEFATNLVSIANDANNLTNQTRQQINNDRNNPQANQPAPATANATDFTISLEQKTITTSVVRQNPAQALSDVAAENRRHAAENGFSVPLTVESTGPSSVSVNGQRWYKATSIVTYEKIDPTVLGPERRRLFEQRVQNQTSTTVVQPTISPVLSIPSNITPTIPTVTPIAALYQPIETLPNVPYPGGIYQRNSRGNNVKLIQERLNRVLKPTTPLVEDGIFGTLTFNAVTQFQQNWNSTNTNKLIVDGRVGTNTWNALFSAPVQSTLAPVVIQQQLTTTLGTPTSLSQPITVPLAQASLPQDRVEQSGPIIIVNVSRTDSRGRDGLTIALEDARQLARARALQTGFQGTPKINSEYRERGDISGRRVFEITYTADYTERGEVSQEGDLAQRQLNVNVLLQQGITPAQINSQYSPPGPVDESGNVINTSTNLFTRTSATARTPTSPTRPRTPAPTPPIATPGFDIDQSQSIFGTPRKLSVFEIEALNNRLNSPFISDEEKVRIRQILGVANQLPADLQLPQDPELEFSQEATRPNLSVTSAGNTAKLSFNAGRVANIEYSLDNGRTWTILNPPSRAGDVVIRDLDNGIYAARVRGIRTDGTKTIPSQPQAVVIRTSQPVIRRTEPATSTSVLVIFDDSVTARDIKNYQFTTRSDNSGWFNALPSNGRGEAVSSPIVVFGLEVDKTYTVRIRAVYKDGTAGNPSNQATFSTFKTRQEGGGLIA